VSIHKQAVRSKGHEPTGWWNVVVQWMVVIMFLALKFINNVTDGRSINESK